MEQLNLLAIPKHRTQKEPEISSRVIRQYVRDVVKEIPARQKKRDARRKAKLERIVLELSEPQAFWLGILLDSTLSAAIPSKATASYTAVLRKLRENGKILEQNRNLFGQEQS